MKNKKTKIIIIAMFMLLVMAGLVATTRAWLTDTATVEKTFVMGQVRYEISAEDIADNQVVVPGQAIITASNVKITNFSTISTDLRIKITGKYANDGAAATDISVENMTNYFLAEMITSGWDFNDERTESGEYASSAGYWYYGTYLDNESTDILAVTDATAGDIIEIPFSITFDGSKIGNTYANDVFTVTITIEAKQADHVNWSQMASIDFTTGLVRQ